MASTSETGHIKNVSLFEDLITYCQSYGTDYNPSNAMISIAQLQSAYSATQTALNDFKSQKTSFDMAVNQRRNAFDDIKPLSTRIYNALIASGAPSLTIDDAKGINKKMQGTKTPKVNTEMTNTENSMSPKTISTSQQSYDRLIDHLVNLIELLQQTPQYNPNENDLKVAQLQAKVTNLQSAKTAWIAAFSTYSNAIRMRDEKLYHPETGIVSLALKAKKYVKSLYGAQSTQYKQIGALAFKNKKI
jgi:hypothetical protein